jgi:hypothetical protein
MTIAGHPGSSSDASKTWENSTSQQRSERFSTGIINYKEKLNFVLVVRMHRMMFNEPENNG